MAKSLIIDGNALLHRAFHALPALRNRHGNVGAVYGFFSLLIHALKEIQPNYLLICFDHPGRNFRHQLFIGYQLQRPQLDPSLARQAKLSQELLVKMQLPIFIRPGVEADDVIGSLSQKLSRQQQVFILSGDRDLMQLVNQRVSLLSWQAGTKLRQITPATVKEILGVRPDQVVDYKALVGDSSDEYPGVAGIGPKTAAALLRQYPHLEAIYQHLEQIPPRWREKLERGRAAAKLSQKLATILTDLPLEINLKQAHYSQKRRQLMAQVLAAAHFPSLARRLDQRPPPSQRQAKLF